jgi:phage shock protein PspC (stress-responsive transcriptional regulator)
MKKTLTVNISGIVFHIDEDAYNVLNDYLQSIKQHFSRTEGGDEIVTDIENRIAEMLKERIGDERQVITIDDVEVVINAIGQPSEFGEEFAEEQDSRKTDTNGRKTKRLYRDPDNAILGGVCSGLGAYFHTDPVWFRIAFVVACIPGLGTPLLVYVILWAIIPEAKTAVEKLEMKGEKVNISNIEKSIREEIDHLKNRFSDFTSKAKRTYKKKSEAHRSDLQGVGNALGRILEVFVKIVLVFAGIILFIIGLSLIIVFLAVLFGFGNQIVIVDSELVYISFQSLVDLILGSGGSNMFFTTGLFLLLGIPVLMILYGGVKLIFGLDRTRHVGSTAFILWLAGLALCLYYGYKISKSFSQSGTHQETVDIIVTDTVPVVLDVKNIDKFEGIYRYEDYYEFDDLNMILTNEERDFYYGLPKLEIQKSYGQSLELEMFYRAKGKSHRDAVTRAENTVYHYSINGNTMSFDPYFKLGDHEVWREQQVEMVLYVPVGTYLQFSDDMHRILNEKYHRGYKLSGETWQMTETGLEETEFKPIEYEEEIHKDVPDSGSDQSNEGKPVSLITFIFSNVLQILGFNV